MTLKRLLTLCLLALTTAAMAADMSEAQFKSWMSGLTLDGLKFYEIEKDGSKLQASFINPAAPQLNPRMVTMTPLAAFADYQKMLDNPKMRMGPTQGFSFKGLRVITVDTQSEIGMLVAVDENGQSGPNFHIFHTFTAVLKGCVSSRAVTGQPLHVGNVNIALVNLNQLDGLQLMQHA